MALGRSQKQSQVLASGAGTARLGRHPKGPAFSEGPSSGALRQLHPRFLALDSKEARKQEAAFLSLSCGLCVVRKSGYPSDSLHVLSPFPRFQAACGQQAAPEHRSTPETPRSHERCSQGLGHLTPCCYGLALSTRRWLIPKAGPHFLTVEKQTRGQKARGP